MKLKSVIMALPFYIMVVACSELTMPSASPIQPKALTPEEIAWGLKEALTLGAQHSTENASGNDGFLKNPLLFIPFPEEAARVRSTLEKAGFSKQVDEFVRSLNQAAGEASAKALPIFTDAIARMSISDAFGILNGNSDAATAYLRNTTATELSAAFRPIVKDALAKGQVAKYWEPLASNYNRLTLLTGGERVNPNLELYVTERAISGLFILLAQEEKKIRENPSAQVTDLLRRVFGNR